MPMSLDLTTLQSRRDDLLQRLASIGDLRPGSLAGAALPQVRQSELPLCGLRGARTRAELVADTRSRRQDSEARDSGARSRADAAPDCRVQALAKAERGVGRGQ